MNTPFTKFKFRRVLEYVEEFQIESLNEDKLTAQLIGECPMDDLDPELLIKYKRSELTIKKVTLVSRSTGRKERWKGLAPPDRSYSPGTVTWDFGADLRGCLPGDDNHAIEIWLRAQKVLARSTETDSESACFHAYFKTLKAGEAFLRRLNTAYRKLHQ